MTKDFNTPLGRFNTAQRKAREVMVVDDVENEEQHFSAGPEDQYPSIPSQQDLVPSRNLQSTAAPKRFPQPQHQQPLHEKVNQMRSASQISKQKVDPDVRDAVTVLLGLGRSYRDVEVDGVIFTLRSLSPKEILLVAQSGAIEGMSESFSQAFTNITQRNMTLAFSISKIDGTSWQDVLKTDNHQQKMEVIENMDETVLDHLFTQYVEMMNQHRNKFKTVEEAVEEIKK